MIYSSFFQESVVRDGLILLAIAAIAVAFIVSCRGGATRAGAPEERKGRSRGGAAGVSADGIAVPAAQTDELLPIGVDAPDVALLDERGNVVRIRDFRGDKNVVLVFYPGDGTPGCTKQLCTIRDDFARFQDAETRVFGVNPQSAKSHLKFVERRKFPFPLLVDSDRSTVRAYGCEGRVMTIRTVYAIDKEGKIVFAERGMPSTDRLLKALGR